MQLVRFDTRQDLCEAIADALEEFMGSPTDVPEAAMLAGGSTPLPAYQILARRCPAVPSRKHLLLSDERMVPADSPESNLGNVLQALKGLARAEETFIPVHTELPLDEVAARYHAELCAFLDGGGRMALGLLGLGADGHTASLFNLEDAARADGRLAIAVRRETGPARVSVTRSLLRRFDRLIFLAAGEEKTEIVARFFENPCDLPAGRAVAGIGAVEMWVQRETSPPTVSEAY